MRWFPTLTLTLTHLGTGEEGKNTGKYTNTWILAVIHGVPQSSILRLILFILPAFLWKYHSGRDIKSWMTSNFLLLHSDKTEVIVFSPKTLRDRFHYITLHYILTLDGILLAFGYQPPCCGTCSLCRYDSISTLLLDLKHSSLRKLIVRNSVVTFIILDRLMVICRTGSSNYLGYHPKQVHI